MENGTITNTVICGAAGLTTQLHIHPLWSFDKVIRAQLTHALMTEHHSVSACSQHWSRWKLWIAFATEIPRVLLSKCDIALKM